jgi:glycosyltransferase involved in cell wall biosynthesis
MSDDPETPSGFGNVTRWVCDGLRRRGHKVSILGWQAEEPYDWNGCHVYPSGAEPLGKAGLYPFLLRHRPDIVVALADIWWLPYANSPHIRRHLEMTGTPWGLYFPVDGDCGEGLPPSWIELLRTVDAPVAMARYGREIVQRAGVRCEYIPHGVDPDIFAPPPDREAVKAELGLQGRFVILSDSRNQPRKLLPRLLDIFARVSARNPCAHLHLHTDPDDEFTRTAVYSYDIRADIRALGLDGRISITPGMTVRKGGGVPLETLARYYQAADVHVLASSGEGFGLPTLQAASAGAVPLAVDYSANKELIEGHGVTIAVADWAHTEFGVRRALPDVEDAADKILALAADRQRLADLSRRARAFALDYAWEGLVDQWDRLLRAAPARLRARAGRQPERSIALESIAPRAAPAWAGVSINVKLVERPAGALEAMIRADARGRGSDIAIPTRPPACRVGKVAAPRQAGFVGVGGGDGELFQALKAIFPILHGWTPAGDDDALGAGEEIERLPLLAPEEARYALARSILMLDVGSRMPAPVLADAAHLGVPCVHGGDGPAAEIWPELAAATMSEAFAISRELLTDPTAHRRASEAALHAIREKHPCDPESLALSLKRLYAQETGDYPGA